jgi:hypothetical protein
MRAWEDEGGFRVLLKEDEQARARLGESLDGLFAPGHALRNTGVVFDRVEELKGRLKGV